MGLRWGLGRGEGAVREEDELVDRIIALQREVQYYFAHDRSEAIFSLHLTLPQIKMLFLLSLRPNAAGQELSRTLGVSLATVTGTVDRLVAQGLVTRREDPHDRRVRRIDLSPAGRDIVDRMVTAGMERMRRILDRLPVEELRVVEQASVVLTRALAEESAAFAADSGVTSG
jgi:DNA-binding MarR family transcriptional regulator